MGFDIIGSREKAVAVISEGGARKASEIMRKHKNVKTVLLRSEKRTGSYRLYEMKILRGESDTQVVHKEAGCFFFIDPQKAYFSTRESTERARIAKLVRGGENVMVFFAGVGPLPVIIGKKTKAEKVTGIEINPEAVKYFVLNIVKNKLKNAEAVLGDVKKESRKYYGSYDRVLMPLPETACKYLENAIRCCSAGGIVHYYFFGSNEDVKKERERIKKACEKAKRRCIISKNVTKVLPYGPGVWKTRLDFRIYSKRQNNLD